MMSSEFWLNNSIIHITSHLVIKTKNKSMCARSRVMIYNKPDARACSEIPFPIM